MSKHSKRGDATPRGAREAEARAAGYRHERLSRLLREELDALVRDDLDDPRVEGVRVTYVELSVDYKSARVGFVVARTDAEAEARSLEREPAREPLRDRVARALERATPFLRARLAESIDLKQVPALRFLWDAEAAAFPREMD